MINDYVNDSVKAEQRFEEGKGREGAIWLSEKTAFQVGNKNMLDQFKEEQGGKCG